MSRRVWLAVVLLFGAGAAGAAWWWSTRPVAAPYWQGYVEADFVSAGAIDPGLLTTLSVQRGDAVTAGAPLFALDDAAERAARDQAAGTLEQAERQLANLGAGAKPTEIEQAEANLADADATAVRARLELQRNQGLLPYGAVSKEVVEQNQADYKSAVAKVDAMRAALAQSRAPLGRMDEIQAQRAAVAAAKAALASAAWQLDRRHVAAPAAGRVADVLARPGDVLTAGQPVVSLLEPGNIFIRFFVPETALSTIHLGDTVALACDTCPADRTARISFISPTAEYTPPMIYSEASQSKLVFLVEARPTADVAVLLNPGQPMQVRPKS